MRKTKKFITRTIILIFIVLVLFFSYMGRKNIVHYVSTYTNALVETNIVNCLNSSTSDAVNKYREMFDNFINIQYGDNNVVKLLTVNMLYVNLLQRDIASLSLSYLLDYCETQKIYIPSGAFLGSVLFSGKGKKIEVSIIPIGSTLTSYDIVCESVGINTTRFAIYLTVTANVKVTVPFYTNDVMVSTDVIVIESIMPGEVPPYLIS